MTICEYVAEHGHDKYDRYFPVYDDTFGRWEHAFRLLEIGCSERSLETWRDCFPLAEITGLDLNPGGATNQEDLAGVSGVTYVEGDQRDVDLLRRLGAYDVVVDDGGHIPVDQILTFTTLFPLMPSGGWYFIEDLHTSYYGGGYGPESAVDFLKELLDDMHSAQMQPPRTPNWPVAELRLIDSLVAIRRS